MPAGQHSSWPRVDQDRSRGAPFPSLTLRGICRGAGYRQLDDMTSDVYLQLLALHGRELRPPLQPRHLGAVMQGLIEGIGLRHRIDPDAVDDPGLPGGAGLYPLVTACLLAALSRPFGDTSTLTDHLQETLAGPAGENP